MYKDEEDYINQRLNELMPITRRSDILYEKMKTFDDALFNIIKYWNHPKSQEWIEAIAEYPRVLRAHLDVRDEIEYLIHKLKSIRMFKKEYNESGND